MRVLYAALPPRDGYLPRALSEAGHVVEIASDLPELSLALERSFDAVVVEAERAGPELLSALTGRRGRCAAILVLDAAAPAARVRMLQGGIDACFVRPVQFMELEARLAALVRLSHPDVEGRLSLDPARRRVRLGDRELALPTREFALLHYLHDRPDEVVSPERLLVQVWGDLEHAAADRVRSAVARLRARSQAALGTPLVETVRGVGYRLHRNMKQSSSG